MQYTQLLFDVRDAVASITLNRPETLNALNLELARELMEAAMACHGNRDVRAVVFSGSGSAFCAGGDLKSFAAQGEHLPTYLQEVTTYQLAMGPTLALGATKRLLHLGWSASLETQMMDEGQVISTMVGSADGQEGIVAFLQKRPAHFVGK